MKCLYWFLLSIFLLANLSYARTLHLIVVEDDINLDSKQVTSTLEREAEGICNSTGIDMKKYFLSSGKSNSTEFTETLHNIRVSTDDVIWFYYIGKSRIYDSLNCVFQFGDRGFALKEVHQFLKEKNARLTISTSDCIISPYKDAINSMKSMPRHSFMLPTLVKLFVHSRGDIYVINKLNSNQLDYLENSFIYRFVNFLHNEMNDEWEKLINPKEKIKEFYLFTIKTTQESGNSRNTPEEHHATHNPKWK